MLVAVAFVLVLLGTLTKSTAEFSRLWMGYWFLLSLGSLLLVRRTLRTMDNAGWLGRARRRRVVIVGAGESARAVIRQSALDTHTDYEFTGCISTGSEAVLSR